MRVPQAVLRALREVKAPPFVHVGAHFFKPGGVGELTKAYVCPFTVGIVVKVSVCVSLLD
jgi:hypothetical protein